MSTLRLGFLSLLLSSLGAGLPSTANAQDAEEGPVMTWESIVEAYDVPIDEQVAKALRTNSDLRSTCHETASGYAWQVSYDLDKLACRAVTAVKGIDRLVSLMDRGFRRGDFRFTANCGGGALDETVLYVRPSEGTVVFVMTQYGIDEGFDKTVFGWDSFYDQPSRGQDRVREEAREMEKESLWVFCSDVDRQVNAVTGESRAILGEEGEPIDLHDHRDWWDDDHLVETAEGGMRIRLLRRVEIEDVPGYSVERCQIEMVGNSK